LLTNYQTVTVRHDYYFNYCIDHNPLWHVGCDRWYRVYMPSFSVCHKMVLYQNG